ncbi:MAG: DNA polymerase III subunit beta [Acidobacteriota bacterium]|nr:DNA polymerase III subunit beta [Blastocatellia bacterium]MDW8412468.1 DNA polymerase III subunit beta [Acidobacteriota bacterium]
MDFSIKRGILQKELQLLQGVVDRKSTIPALQNIYCRAVGDRLELTATDYDITLRTGCEASVKVAGETLLPARKLAEILRNLPDMEVSIRKGSDTSVVVECGRTRFRLPVESVEDFPRMPEVSTKEHSVPGQVLRVLLRSTLFTITQDEARSGAGRYALSSLQLSTSGENIRAVATDGHRLAYAAVRGNLGLDSVLIPRKAVVEMERLLLADAEENVGVAKAENQLAFVVGSRRLLVKLFAGTFPNWELVMPKQLQYSVEFSREELKGAIRRAALCADANSKAVRLMFTRGLLTATSESSDAGESTDQIDCNFEGPDLQIAFNSEYLLDFLEAIDSERVLFEFKDPTSQALLRPIAETAADAVEVKYVVMPMRL